MGQKRCPVRVLLLVVLCWIGSAGNALAKDPDGADQPSPEVSATVRDANVEGEKLADILWTLREERQKARRWEAALGITSGLALGGFAGWRLVADPGDNQLALGLGVLFTGFAALNLARGITALRPLQLEEELWLRFNEALETGMTETDISRFEGELYATARARWRQRRVDRWFGFARAIGGAVVAGILPLTNANRSTRRSGYIVGSLFFSVGMVEFGRSYKASAAERAWDDYQNLQ